MKLRRGGKHRAEQTAPAEVPRQERTDAPVYLGDRKLLVRTNWGGRLVVPTFNLDVAVGAARDGVIEPWTTRLVQERLSTDQVAVNVGANFGYYTVLAAMIVGHRGRVVSIEANPHIVPYLVSSIYWSGVPDRVELYHCAAWHESGKELNFSFSPAFLGGGTARELWAKDDTSRPMRATLEDAIWDHRMVDLVLGENRRLEFGFDRVVPFTVPTRTIDEICAALPEAHLLHMDIEGAEAFALQGARKLIERSPALTIIFEWSSHRFTYGTPEARAGFEEIWTWLADAGFRVREVQAQLAPDGGLFIGKTVSFEYMARGAANGDFVAVRPGNDPWG